MQKIIILVTICLVVLASSMLCWSGHLPSDVVAAEFAALIGWIVGARVKNGAAVLALVAICCACSCPYRPVPTFTAADVKVKSECAVCTKDVVVAGVQFAVDFWTLKEYPRDCIENVIHKSFITCTGTPEKIINPGDGRHVSAYVILGETRWAFLACKQEQKVIESLVIHELSHIIVYDCGPPNLSANDHHDYFNQVGLGH